MPRRESVAGTASDPLVKFWPLELDGKTYKLSYDFNAIAEAEKLAGCNLLMGMGAMLISYTTAQQMRGLLYAAVRKAHPKMTIEECGQLIRIDTIADIKDAIVHAYNESLPEANKIISDPSEGGDEPPSS